MLQSLPHPVTPPGYFIFEQRLHSRAFPRSISACAFLRPILTSASPPTNAAQLRASWMAPRFPAWTENVTQYHALVSIEHHLPSLLHSSLCPPDKSRE